MNEPAKINYALAIDSAVVFVARALDKAAPAALSITELAKTYTHPVPSDFSRVKRHEGAADDDAAREWIIRHAISYLGDRVAVVDQMVTFVNGHTFDDLRLRGKKVPREEPDIHVKLRDPFNPMTGVFSGNIRESLHEGSEDTAYAELRESLKSYGWVKEFPALADERGVVLVGHRRMALAKELGIAPVIKTLTLGQGDAADAERLKLAIVSNIASKKLSPKDRKRIAAYLYKDHEWSQQKIAEALSVSQYTVSTDLNELLVTNNSEKPKRGRPKRQNSLINVIKKSRAEKNAENDARVHPLIEEGVSRADIAGQLGVSEGVVQRSQQRFKEQYVPPVEDIVDIPDVIPSDGDAAAIALATKLAEEYGPTAFKLAVCDVWRKLTGGSVSFD